jgi:hypothetical protein
VNAGEEAVKDAEGEEEGSPPPEERCKKQKRRDMI